MGAVPAGLAGAVVPVDVVVAGAVDAGRGRALVDVCQSECSRESPEAREGGELVSQFVSFQPGSQVHS